MDKNERIFANHIEKQGKIYFFEPKAFPLPMPFKSYRPDFYVIEDDMFYEVAATRQAYSYRRTKVGMFRKTYSALTIKVVNPDGSLYRACSARVKVPINSYNPIYNEKTKTSTPIQKYLNHCTKGNQLKVLDYIVKNNLTLSAMAIKINTSSNTIHNFLANKTDTDYPRFWSEFLKLSQNNPFGS